MTTLPTARLLVLLLPVAIVGLGLRAYYTPDEPREASLVVAMAHQADRALPELAGRPFAEKPPLLYWLGGAAVAALGPAPGVARLPNFLYLIGTALAIGALVARAAGTGAGFAAGIAAATMLQLYGVLIWLATDAPLVAGAAVALLGAFLGLTAADARARRRGYLLFHAGLAVAFFAKGPAGWMVPVLAFMTVIVVERRWRELWSPEFWAGVPLAVLAIGAWIYAVARGPGGVPALKVLFWYNLVGRAVALDAPSQFAYASGHANSPAKYLVELPLYLLPWTPLAFAALRRAARGLRREDAEGTAWRLALGAIGLPTVLLSLAATARGVYYGPPALGFAIAVGLYVGRAGAALDRVDRIAWRLTGVLVALVAVVCGACAAIANFAPRGEGSAVLGALSVAGALVAAWLALTPRVPGATALPRLAVALCLTLSLVVAPLYLELNRWLSLERMAQRIEAAAAHAALIVVDPDETTLGLVDLYLPRAQVRAIVRDDDPSARETARGSFGPDARLLWLVPNGTRWRLDDWLAFLGYRDAAVPVRRPEALPEGFGRLAVECVLSRPGGRSFALLAPEGSAPPTGAACD